MNTRFFSAMLFAGAILTGMAPRPGQALMLADVILFPDPTYAIDEHSGTSIDYLYRHVFNDLNSDEAHLLSATLRLTHSENLNQGPRTEIWAAGTKTGAWIGYLSESETTKTEDAWLLPDEILKEIVGESPWMLEIGLSEQTAYNREKINLHESRLEIEYERRSEVGRLTVPEPATVFLLGSALFLFPWVSASGRRS